MLNLSIDEQDLKLRAECPQFSLVAHRGLFGVWEGTLRPICQTYRVRIIYFPRMFFPGFDLTNPIVSVFVLDPPVGPDPRGTGEPTPHVYRLGHSPTFPQLCISDPVDDAWKAGEAIVDRIIPWTIKWLLFYEVWLTIGEWRGGGRHPEPPTPCLNRGNSNLENGAQRDQSLSDAFHSLGRRIGISGSYPLMAVASEASSRPLSWLDWSAATPAAIQSRITSILLRAPRLAASSHWDSVLAIRPADLLDLYVDRGAEIFPPFADTRFGRLKRGLRDTRHYLRYLYDRSALERVLQDKLGDRLFGDSKSRLCIPAFEGKHSEVFVFKTPHHRDYRTDRFEKMINVAMAKAAAPSYFRPLEHNDYVLVDGGTWCNNPVMLAVVEALTCFDVSREQIDVLSLGCGDDRYVVSQNHIAKAGCCIGRRLCSPRCACSRSRRLTRSGFCSARRQ